MGISYYYCSHERQRQGHTSSQEACSFLRWVIRDLTTQVTRPKARSSNTQAVIPKKLEDLYAKHDLSVQGLLECLLIVTEYIAREYHHQVCIIVDAVDESPLPRDAMLSVLTTIGANTEWQHVSLCFTSRNEVDIAGAIEAIQPPKPSQPPQPPSGRRSQHFQPEMFSSSPATPTDRVFLSPVGPSKKLERNAKTNFAGFDGSPSSSHGMPPPSPVGNVWERGRNRSGGAFDVPSSPYRLSRSAVRPPSADETTHQDGSMRSMSMGPAKESPEFDPMEIDSRMEGCTILSMDDNPDVKEAIRTFVRSQLQASEMRGTGEGELEDIINLIARRAKGMQVTALPHTGFIAPINAVIGSDGLHAKSTSSSDRTYTTWIRSLRCSRKSPQTFSAPTST